MEMSPSDNLRRPGPRFQLDRCTMHSTNSRRNRSIRLSVELLETRHVLSTTFDLGVAADFNAFVFADMTAATSDTEGRVAVGHDATFYAYGIGDKLPNSNGTRNDLIVGHDLTYTYGQVFNGNIVYGDTGALNSVGTPNGTARQQSGVIDFAAAQASLTTMSNVLGAEAPNGVTTVRHSNLTLRGTNTTLDIFTVSAAQLAGAKNLCIIVPRDATVIVNVPDNSISIEQLGFRLRGTGCEHVLWNFPQATDLTISGVGLKGSFLAPNAAMSLNNGQIDGTVVVNSFNGTGELHLCRSEVRVVIPDPAGLQGVVFVDVNQNDQRDDPAIEVGLDGADVILTGIDSLGRHISRDALSLNGGTFVFDRLWPGTYTVTVVPPQKYQASAELGIPGSVNGTPMGAAAVNQVTLIVLGEGQTGVDYLFPLEPPPK
jgi:choice-of-anchor A domain-containing protein